jgi:DNA-binding SARP family transcriptional activator
VQFRILGPLEVVADGRPLGLGRRKQRALLAILLVHANRVVSLDRLVDQLWGEEPPAQAIASLQAYVSHLRRLLEPDRSARTPAGVLISQPPGYRLVVAPDDVDASRFEALAARGRNLLEAGEHQEAAAALAEGLELWRGPVLADFPDAPFAAAERTRLEELRLVAQEDRATADLALGRHAAVIAELERLVADHPFREGLHGLRMLALYRSGRQAEALNAYQVARRALRQELGIDPSPQLRQLEADILRQAPQLDWLPARLPTTAAAPPLSTEARGTDLVGREEQLGVLEAALADAAAGRGRLVLVAGEPGIGKTRLAEEGVQRATRDGVAVAWGRCWEEQGAPPFWPWVQVLRELLADTPPARLPAVLGSDTPDLVPLLPELGERAGAVPYGPVLDVETVRFRLCHAVMALLRRLASSRPLLLVLDDLQWADAASLRLLSMLGGALRGAHILIVATFRSPDADGGDRLAHTLATLARAAPVDRMVLRGLSSAHVSRMMAAELGAEPNPELARVVHDRTDGNPFFVVELLRLLGGGGQQAAALEIPAGVRDVLRRRLAQLPEQTNAVLLVAAISGREFDLDTVMAVTELDDDQALEAVEAALLSGLVVEDADTVGRFRFAHALVREVIYDDVSRVRRARLHARVAQALEQRQGADRGEHALALAYHWWAATPVVGADVVLSHLLAGADQALSRLAHEEAEQQLRRALELLASTPPSPERTRSELAVQLRLGALCSQLEGAAAPSTWAAVARAGELADELGDDAATVAAYRSLYEVAVARAEHDAARRLAERMLVIAERSRNPALLSIAHLAVGRTLWCLGKPTAAREHLDQSLRLAVEVPTAPHEPLPTLVTVQLQLAPVLDLLGEREEAAELLESAISSTQKLSPLIRAGVLTSAALVTALGRDVTRAREYSAEALRLAAKLPTWSGYASAVLEWTKAVDGDPILDIGLLRRSLDDIEAGGGQHLVAWGRGLLAEAEMLTGRPDEALRLLDDALRRVARTGERMYEAELHRLRDRAVAYSSSDSQPAESSSGS